MINWIRNFGKTIREKLCSTIVSDDVKEIEILEVDELFTYYQNKRQKVYVWIAVDRSRNTIIDIRLSKSKEKSVFLEMA